MSHRRFGRGKGRKRGAGAMLVAWAATLAVAAGAPGRVAADDAVTRLDPVQVTATRVPQKVSEQASAVSVVTREDIELRVPEVAGDVLRTIPGVEVQRAGSTGNRENIRIRGAKSTQTLVLIDGFPVNSPSTGEFDIGALPAAVFERVEVVRGAQSALYGSSAMGGVVNFLPRAGSGETEAGLGIFGGSRDTLKGNGYVSAGGPARSFFLGAEGFRSDGTMPNDRTELGSFLGVGNARVGERSRAHAIALYADAAKGIPISYFKPLDYGNRNFRRDLLLGARWETDVSKTLGFSASGSVLDERFHVDDPRDPGEADSLDSLTRSRKSTVTLMARYAPCPASTTFLGVEYMKDRARNVVDYFDNTFGPYFSYTVTDDAVVNRSAFLQEELHPTRNSGVSLGIRLDRNSTAGTQVNPKAAGYYAFEPSGIRVRAAAGRGFRNPTIVEKTDPFVGNATLTAEKARSWEAGVDVPFPDRRGSVSATWFYQDFRGLIQYNSRTFLLANVNDAISRGVEAGIGYRFLPEVGAEATFTYTKTRDKMLQQRVLGIPDRRGSVSLLLSPVPQWESRIDWIAEGDQLDAPLYSGRSRRPGFARVDVFSKYRWEPADVVPVREVALTGRVRNALDRKYEEKLDLPAPGFEFLLGIEARI